MKNWKQTVGRLAVVPVLALGMAVSLAAYHTAKPVVAKAAAPTPGAAPLDDNSVSALLALDHAMETLAARVTPAIVNVAVTSKPKADEQAQAEIPDEMRQFFGPGFNFPRQQQPQIEHGIGSGVIISPDGYIVTNNHVVEGAVDLRVTMSDRRVLPAKLIGTDPLTDLAVIKVEGKNFPSVPWGDATKLHPGQTVLAFGNPFGFRFTVTRGIVSALNRPNPSPTDARKPGQFIQTDAAINPGNSGGPLVDARGEVVGINTFLISNSGTFSGMGFAIPTQIVRPTVETLIRDGKVSHGYMGLGITDVTPENAKFFDSKDNRGTIVTQVETNSPAAKAGLKIGDLITGLDGHEISDASQLQVQVGQTQPGTTIKLQVMRDGKSMDLPVTLEKMGARDKAEDETASAENGKPRWGLGLGEITPDVRQQLRGSGDLKGAVVERVLPGSPADNAGLRPGDVILSVNRREVHSVADAQRDLGSIPKGQDALLLVWSNGGNTFRVLHSSEGA
ncbi:MAG: Do family serine endopeptidase [Terriglobales bacterium]